MSYQTNKTAGEIWDAMSSGKRVVMRFFDEGADPSTDQPIEIQSVVRAATIWDVSASVIGGYEFATLYISFYADSASDYPTASSER